MWPDNFLDVIVKLGENEFLTDLYCKKTVCHHCLHYDSYHPEHMTSVYSVLHPHLLRYFVLHVA